jgi:hypothetical protein
VTLSLVMTTPTNAEAVAKKEGRKVCSTSAEALPSVEQGGTRWYGGENTLVLHAPLVSQGH